MREKAFKEFSMNNLLIETELQQIEKSYGYNLGKNTLKINSGHFAYFKFDDRLKNEAMNMAYHYQLFYCLERSIRDIVSDNLKQIFQDDWWEKEEVIPKHINEEVKKRVQKEQELGVTRRSDFMIDYTTFGELKEIIIKNWSVFDEIFTNQRAVDRVFKDLIALRNPIAHCCPLAEDEVERLALTVKDWFRLMEKK